MKGPLMIPELSDDQWNALTTIWNFHHVNARQIEDDIDLLLVTGSHDERVAHYAAQVAQNIQYKQLVISGGKGKITSESNKLEASRFAAIMINEGVSKESILLEKRASNSGENFLFTKELLDSSIDIHSGLVITKPYMERRMLLTGRKQWPEVQWYIMSEPVTLEDYLRDDVDPIRSINLMVGDVDRITKYADRGFMERMVIPDDVSVAFRIMVDAGFTTQLLR